MNTKTLFNGKEVEIKREFIKTFEANSVVGGHIYTDPGYAICLDGKLETAVAVLTFRRRRKELYISSLEMPEAYWYLGYARLLLDTFYERENADNDEITAAISANGVRNDTEENMYEEIIISMNQPIILS